MELASIIRIAPPAKNPYAGKPVPFASLTASKINSYEIAEINVPAPNAMMTPRVRLPKENLEPVIPLLYNF